MTAPEAGRAPSSPVVLVSFDVDGTMEDGDPPGPVEISLLRRAQQLGYIIGSSSDRTLSDQTRLWEQRGIVPDFVSHKHHLPDVAVRFEAVRKLHIGDTDIDAHFAHLAGYEFVLVTELPAGGTPGWIF